MRKNKLISILTITVLFTMISTSAMAWGGPGYYNGFGGPRPPRWYHNDNTGAWIMGGAMVLSTIINSTQRQPVVIAPQQQSQPIIIQQSAPVQPMYTQPVIINQPVVQQPVVQQPIIINQSNLQCPGQVVIYDTTPYKDTTETVKYVDGSKSIIRTVWYKTTTGRFKVITTTHFYANGTVANTTQNTMNYISN